MIRALGLDLGGTKIAAQLFDDNWDLVGQRRDPTPATYPALVSAVVDQIAWARATAGAEMPIGIALAGLINKGTGLGFAANIPTTGQPFPADLAKAVGQPVTVVNDCRALVLSEAVFGAARGMSPAVGLIIGTGIGGGVAVDGHLIEGLSGLGGEFGHFAIAAGPVMAQGLPVITCGCGRPGCSETWIAGPGLQRLARHMTGRTLLPPEIATGRDRDPALAKVWQVWCGLVAETLKTLIHVVDPACIVIGGGLSKAPGLLDDLTAALEAIQLPGFPLPALRLAEGGDASGARGAAYAAWTESPQHG